MTTPPNEQQAIARTVINRIAAARALPAPWPDTDADLPEGLADTDLTSWGAGELGDMRERLAAKDERESGGIWYTAPDLAASIARFALSVNSCEPGCTLPGCELRMLTLDPACGAGVFLVATARGIARRYATLATGQADPPDWAVSAVLPTVMTECVYGIDIDPVAVDLARAACWLEIGGTRPADFMDANITVGDPLAGDSPKALEDRLGDPDPLLIIGNPPYREHAKGAAPWLEARRGGGDELFPRPSMDEFRAPGQGRYEGKLSNLWTFFWRWAAWKALETRDAPGTVALITPKAYLTGPTFDGMRAHLRRSAREGWVIDISADPSFPPPIRTRLFPGVKTPLVIGVFTTHQRSGTELTA